MNIVIGSDHRGFELKSFLKCFLENHAHNIIDVGPVSSKSVDYPIYAKKAVEKILNNSAERGILICGSGIGMSLAANRFKGIRAALCYSLEQVVSSRRHNNANILVLAGDHIGWFLAEEWVTIWLKENFDSGRHKKRIEQLDS